MHVQSETEVYGRFKWVILIVFPIVGKIKMGFIKYAYRYDGINKAMELHNESKLPRQNHFYKPPGAPKNGGIKRIGEINGLGK
jgi:hypothetical protein